MDQTGDQDVLRVWTLLSEVSEQLSQNRSASVNLHALSDGAKAQAIHSQTGFVLRRFNLDKPKEAYDAELERMNASMSAENQTLLNDNRQLSALIREYEQTLENIMATFRTRAHEVQQRELALMRQYESVIVERETEALSESLTVNNARSESLARVGRMLRAVIRRLGGEDIQAYEAYEVHAQALAATGRHGQSRDASSSSTAAPHPKTQSQEPAKENAGGAHSDEGKERDSGGPQDDTETAEVNVDRLLEEEDDPDKRIAAAEWALDRESELARLERENEELRALVNGLLKPPSSSSPAPTHQTIESTSSSVPIPIPDNPNGDEGRDSDESPFSTLPRPQQQQQRLLGGRPGTVGPFGTFKRTTVIRMNDR